MIDVSQYSDDELEQFIEIGMFIDVLPNCAIYQTLSLTWKVELDAKDDQGFRQQFEGKTKLEALQKAVKDGQY
jgi:hypothetical protein